MGEEANIGVFTEDNHIKRVEDMSIESAENNHNEKELTENCFEDEESSIALVESDERDDEYPNIMEEISPVRRNSVYKPKPEFLSNLSLVSKNESRSQQRITHYLKDTHSVPICSKMLKRFKQNQLNLS